jgi:hypothetical protein
MRYVLPLEFLKYQKIPEKKIKLTQKPVGKRTGYGHMALKVCRGGLWRVQNCPYGCKLHSCVHKKLDGLLILNRLPTPRA